ncbi:MAG: hypothetical protein QOJ64_63 [Acidobacteriota bacterium]|nr:hypothetical protein [Acidobacteriota bacterium]
MKPRIRIIKHRDQRPEEPEIQRREAASLQNTRDISSTIKLWISEYRERRRTDEQHSRIANKLILERGVN